MSILCKKKQQQPTNQTKPNPENYLINKSNKWRKKSSKIFCDL